MHERDEILTLVDELLERIRRLSEKQDAQYTDVVLHLKQIEDQIGGLVQNAEVRMIDEDEVYESAREIVIDAKKASTSLLQRKLGIGYSRAAHILDKLEEEGVIGAAAGSKPRGVLEN
jgi:DNA segregation ATPase FtsK/SpoIIIE, S-DNA-T family